MVDEPKTTRLATFTQIVQVISGLSLVLGVIFTSIQIVDLFGKLDSAAVSTKLSALTAMNQFIEDDAKVRQQMERFLSSDLANDKTLLEFVHSQGSGRAAYDSQKL